MVEERGKISSKVVLILDVLGLENFVEGGLGNIHSKSWWPWWPDSANFFHFPPKFRLRTRKPSRLHCTNASNASVGTCRQAGGDSTGQGLRWEKQVALYISGQQQWLCSDQKASGGGAHTAILCLVFVFNINTSDLLYFDIMLLKTPDLCNLRTFVAIFFLSRFTHIFRQFLEAKKQTPPIYPLLECMILCSSIIFAILLFQMCCFAREYTWYMEVPGAPLRFLPTR